MKKSILLLLTLLFWIFGCTPKPNHNPKSPNYAIRKPKVKFTPSKKNLAKMVKQLQGSPYVWAEEGPNNFDCSGFTYYLYGSMGIEIPRVARSQALSGKRISVDELQYGDLIFFATDKYNAQKITHVGMYLGDGWFTHASTVKHEVVYSNLFKSKYYKRKLRVCRRYLPNKSFSTVSKKAPAPAPAPWDIIKTKAPSNQDINNSKAIVIKAPIEEIELNSTKKNFYVQAGSFVGTPRNDLIHKVKQQKLPYKIIQFPKENTHMSKILIGPYPSRGKTLLILTKVQKTINKDAFIAEIR